MKPLNYAILKFFTSVDEADADTVMDNLKEEYGNFRAFKKKSIIESIMTATANGLLEETRFDLDDKGELRVYYHADPDGEKIINKYIPD